MSVAELQELEEVKLLVAKGQQTGTLTFTEVATALSADFDDEVRAVLRKRVSALADRFPLYPNLDSAGAR